MSTDIYYNFIFITHTCFCSYRETEREDYAVWLRDKFTTEACLNAIPIISKEICLEVKNLKNL